MTNQNIYFNKNGVEKTRYWYHGTTDFYAEQIIKNGIVLDAGNKRFSLSNTDTNYQTYDFGPGFYLTSVKKQAIIWAKRQADKFKNLGAKPAIIRVDLILFFENTNVLKFMKPDNNYCSSIRYCRTSGKLDPSFDKYQSVFGPVADGTVRQHAYQKRNEFLKSNTLFEKRIPEKELKEWKKQIDANKFYPKYNQLCLIDITAVNQYIEGEEGMIVMEVIR